jgi:hypothetical protein
MAEAIKLVRPELRWLMEHIRREGLLSHINGHFAGTIS